MSDYSIWLLEYAYINRYPASNLFAAQPFEGFRRMPHCFGLLLGRPLHPHRHGFLGRSG